MRQTALVIAQFFLSAAIVLSANWHPPDGLPVALSLPGVGIAVWAWVTIGLRNIRIHPSPTDRTQLATSGPYHFIRHPMYAGVLWMTGALLWSNPQWWRALAWGVLWLVLFGKATMEEQAMAEQFPDYENLQKRTGMLWPRLGSRK
ncbi:methyltransferase family protein [Novipirellula artificiosorum]|uniref:Isoprenylcysteine carboxyl methyltransferase (ICMT) family protein n=1 Tax=Novipirellula artificiosorum TaxID=2528016 RepID=A0A5C6E027_9BACT|nr:isoprenylcysteine carboxylmethyltransferase family protein [Novipirellula artificiosorum]TWU42222.1 Isoprenylcysteine carboxyl methyltransferase (ICMT) family protein [Novipirellula artificiosorum]